MARVGVVLGRVLVVLLVVASLAAWIQTSIWTVDQTHEGVVLRFGKFARSAPPGFHLTLPWPIERMEAVPTSEVERMSIGFRVGTDVPPRDDEVQWLTGDTNIVELRALVMFRRADPLMYLYGTADLLRPDASAADDDAQEPEPKPRLIRKAAECVMTELLVKMPIDEVLSTGKALLQRETMPRLQLLLDQLHSGVRVTGVDIVEVNPPRDVMSAFTDVASAKADRERRVTEGEGEKRLTMPRARAEADRMLREAETYRTALLNRAHGEADRFLRLQEEIARSPAVGRSRVWQDTVRKVLPWVDLKIAGPASPGTRTRIYLQE